MKTNLIFTAVIAVLILALIGVCISYSNSAPKTALQQLQTQNDTLANRIKQLSAGELNAKQEAYRLQYMYAMDTIELAYKKQQIDSLTRVLTHLKTVTHAQIKAIANLNDAGTDSLYAINKARLIQLIGQQ